jgi:hypothetical protein
MMHAYRGTSMGCASDCRQNMGIFLEPSQRPDLSRWNAILFQSISRGTSDVEKGNENANALAKELHNDDLNVWEDVYRTNVIGCVRELESGNR